jgi:hypothetical protein
LDGEGNLCFVDSAHGWLNLDVASSPNFRRGLLLATEDGGSTWKRLPGDPQRYGSVGFANKDDGWLAGGPGDQHLYATHDGGNSWQEVLLKAPKQSGGAIYPVFRQPPVFKGSKGFLPVTFHGPEETPSALVLYTTSDGGRIWQVQQVLRSTGNERWIPSALIDSTLIIPTGSRGRLALTTVAAERKTSKSAAVVSPALVSGGSEVSFADVNHGWALAGGLMATTDGGATWTDITPKVAVVQPSPPEAVPPSPPPPTQPGRRGPRPRRPGEIWPRP